MNQKARSLLTEDIGPQTGIEEVVWYKSQILLRCSYAAKDGNLCHTFNKLTEDFVVTF